MECSMQAAPKRQSTQSVSFIADDYRKGYKIPEIPYQQYGIIAKELWVRHPSILRIIPGHDDDGQLFPQNINVDSYDENSNIINHLSNTFYMCKTMTGFGASKQGLIVDLPPNSNDRDMFSQSPLDYFHWVVASAVNNKSGRSRFKGIPEWADWTNTQNGGGLPYPKVSMMFQSLAYMVNSRGFIGADNQPLVDEDGNFKPLYTLIVMPHRASWQALMKALVQPQNPALPLDPSTNNKYGAMAEAEGNLLYLNPAPQYGEQRKFYLRPSVQAADKRGWTPEPLPLPEDLCRSLWVPWDKLLKFYTATEQLQLIAAEFGADTVNYIFGNNQEFSGIFIPDEIRAVGLGRYANNSGQQQRAASPAVHAAPAAAPVASAPRSRAAAAPSVGAPSIPAANAAAAAPKAMPRVAAQKSDILHTTETAAGQAQGFNSTLARIRSIRGETSAPPPARSNADLASQLMAQLDSENDD